jgi:hypothetical protein
VITSKAGVVGVVLLMAAPGLLSVALIDDPTGAHLELAPLFLAAAVAALTVRRHLAPPRPRR